MTTSPEAEVIAVEEQEQEQEDDIDADRLHSLPDEVLHLILSKISDPKSLVFSFLISHRIASILADSHSLSLQFPTPIPFPEFSPSTNHDLTSSNPSTTTLSTTLLRFLTLPFRFFNQITAPIPPSPPPQNSEDDLFLRLTKLLCRFNGVRSLRIELPCSCRTSDDRDGLSTVFKWKAKIGLRFELFSFLCPKLVTKIDDELVEDDEEEEEEVDADYLVEHTHYEFYGPVGYAVSLHHLMLLLIARHPNIQSVEITDSKKHGALKLDGEELIRVRNTLDSTPNLLYSPEFKCFPARLKIWYVSRMELSGIVMKKVTLVVFRGNGVVVNASGCGGGGVGEVEDNGDALDGGFEGDGEGIFGEAMKEILTKHRFKARCYPIPQDEADW